MNIAYLSTDPGIPITDARGSSVHVREFTRALAACGHRARVFTVNVGAGATDELAIEPLAVRTLMLAISDWLAREERLQGTHLPSELRRLLFAGDLRDALLARLRDWSPDLIYERYALFGFSGIEAAETLGIPLILEVNAPLRHEQARYRQLDLPVVSANLEREIFTRADGLVVVSSALARYAQSLGVRAERILTLPNGVDAQRFHPHVDGTTVRARYQLQSQFVVGFVGTLRAWHDLMTAFDALTRLRVRHLHLLIVGDGPMRATLSEQVHALQLDEMVTFTGTVAFEDVPAHLAAMDVVLAPYSAPADEVGHYFSPLKVVEAMAMARPVVAAAVGDLPSLIAHGQTGWLYPPGDGAQLARALAHLHANASLCARLGAAARRTVLRAHTWHHKVENFNRFAQRILKERAGNELALAA